MSGYNYIVFSLLVLSDIVFVQVRVYDPSGPQRRPVLDMTFDEYPLTSMSLVPGGKYDFSFHKSVYATLED